MYLDITRMTTFIKSKLYKSDDQIKKCTKKKYKFILYSTLFKSQSKIFILLFDIYNCPVRVLLATA